MNMIIFRKGMIFAVIVLFLGASVVPSISSDVEPSFKVINDNDSNIGSCAKGTATFYPTDDSYVSSTIPDQIAGGLTAFNIRNGGSGNEWAAQPVIKFDISSIPSETDIISASLNIFYHHYSDNDPSGRELTLYRLTGDWNEETITWNNMPAHHSGITSLTYAPSSPNNWMQWDVTGDVQDFIPGQTTNYGWIIKDEQYWGGTGVPNMYCNSKEYGANIPYLEIETEDLPPLVATADATPRTIVVSEGVHFDGSASGGATPYTWDWDFKDGTPHSNQEDPRHTYTSEGTYHVLLTVTDAYSNVDTDTVIITVNPALSCDAGGPYTGDICNPVSFSGTASGGESPYTWHWDFGDGNSSTDQNSTHMYDDIGEYVVTLTVTDDDDRVDSDSTTATITIGVSDLGCTGSLSWSNVKGGETVTGSFTVENIGDSCSRLDWEIESYPDFGSDWTFTPNDGDDLTPADGAVTVEVLVVVPSVKSMVKAALDDQEEEFNGTVKVINKDDPSDYCEIPVSITVPKNIAYSPFIELLRLLMERFPLLNAILNSW